MPGIPVITIPQQGPIATRPRREAVYDTEGWDDGAAIAAKLTIFRSTSAFSNTSLGLTKQFGRDHNFDNAGGQLPKGQMLHWYSVTNKIRPVAAVLSGAATQVVWDVIRRIREGTWWTFKFGNTPYLELQTWQVPEGVGLPDIYTTHNAVTVMAPAPAELEREQGYDVTLADMPVSIGPLESFKVEIESNGVTPTPTVDLYNTVALRGILLKGLQG